jgi:hypothetical protein
MKPKEFHWCSIVASKTEHPLHLSFETHKLCYKEDRIGRDIEMIQGLVNSWAGVLSTQNYCAPAETSYASSWPAVDPHEPDMVWNT